MMELTIRRGGNRAKSRSTDPDFRRADFGLFRHLLGTVPWDTALETRGVCKSWLILKDSTGSRKIHPNKQEIKARLQKACMEEQGAFN